MKIVKINTYDLPGGAARAAFRLPQGQRLGAFTAERKTMHSSVERY